MRVTYVKMAAKALERLDTLTKHRIRQGILGIPSGDIKRLQGHNELFRLRVGDWRIVYSLPNADTVLVERIAPRGDVYKGV